MEYKQKIDRVAIDEQFPYPIKLEYDDENIYLTVLRIPEPEELKLSPWVMNQLAKGHDISDYMGRLVLCIERDNPRKYGLNTRPPYRPYPECTSVKGHPAKGGSFSMVNQPQLIYNNIEVGNTYEFPISNKLINKMAYLLSNANENYGLKFTNIYSNIRGTFRFNVRHPVKKPTSGSNAYNQEYNILQSYEPLYERTGIYSNTAKILLYPE